MVCAHDAGVPIGFQMLGAVSTDPTCQMGGGDGGCTEQTLLDAITNGLEAGAGYMEIYKQDMLAYPDAGAYAHAALGAP